MADWTEAKDPASGKVYYYNSKTGATSWEKPAGFGAGAGAGGWQEAKDPGSGKTYWYNPATGQTTWDNPNGGGGDSLSARKSGILAKRGGIAKKKTAQPQTVGEKLAARAKKFTALRKTERAKATPAAFSRKKGGSKPAGGAGGAAAPAAGWQAVQDPATGNTYYYNAATNETSWTLPQ